jgi:hypothetical protein
MFSALVLATAKSRAELRKVGMLAGPVCGFCPLDRAVGVNPRSSSRYGMRLVVLVPQHQTAMYETYN